MQANRAGRMGKPGQSFTEDYLLYLLAQASSDASAQFHGSLARSGIPVSKWRVLATLYPERQLTIGQLADHCLIKQSTLTRTIDRLEKSGEVRRLLSPDDRRKVMVGLTPGGKELAANLIVRAKEHETEILSSYSAAEIETLKEMLNMLRQRARRLSEPRKAG